MVFASHSADEIRSAARAPRMSATSRNRFSRLVSLSFVSSRLVETVASPIQTCAPSVTTMSSSESFAVRVGYPEFAGVLKVARDRGAACRLRADHEIVRGEQRQVPVVVEELEDDLREHVSPRRLGAEHPAGLAEPLLGRASRAAELMAHISEA